MSKSSWDLAAMPSQAGKRFLITGGNSGIGYAAALELARRGAVVVLACRSTMRGEEALLRMRREAAGGESAAERAELVVLDLASLASVKEIAAAEAAKGLALDGLINNAGVLAPTKRLETQDGFELQFGTNVLGHFALTRGLLPALERAESGRVVTVASIAHRRAKMDFDDLQSQRSYKAGAAYAQSKLGDLMFALELERRLRAAGSRVTSVAVHPGIAKTSLFKVGDGTGLAGFAERLFAGTVGTFFNSDSDGALPTLFGATAAEAEGGGYYGSQGWMETRGGDVGPAEISKRAADADAAKRLWSVCEELTGVKFL